MDQRQGDGGRHRDAVEVVIVTPLGEPLPAHRIPAERDAPQQELSAMRGGLTGTLRLGAHSNSTNSASKSAQF